MKKEILTVLVTSFGFSSMANAACSPVDCDALGYNKTEAACEGQKILRCPFDATKVNCVEKDLNCSVGDIFYSDNTCDANVVSSKTPVGVVGYITDSGKHGGVVSLKEETLQWSDSYNNLTCLPDLDRGGATADMNGVQNTQCIMSSQSIMSQTNTTYPAAAYCNGYAAVSTGKGSKGWYLPAAGELSSSSYSYGAINLSLTKLSKTNLSADWYWSSSEYNYYSTSAWVVSPSDGYMSVGSKNDAFRVRCMLKF